MNQCNADHNSRQTMLSQCCYGYQIIMPSDGIYVHTDVGMSTSSQEKVLFF